MRFDFSRYELVVGEPASFFDLGDLELTGATGSATSRGHRPDRSFMVYPGIVDLVDGLGRLAAAPKESYDFRGPDSSFTVWFTPARRGVLAVRVAGRTLGEESPAELLAGLHTGVHAFLADPRNVLPPQESLAAELDRALAALEALIRRRPLKP